MAVNASKLFGELPLGPLRDKRTVDISTDDFEEDGFVCAAGDLTYRTVDGKSDQTETLEKGAVVELGGVMVLLQVVRSSSTMDSIVIGRL